MKKKELYELAKKHKEKHKIKPKKPLSQMNKNELTAYLKMTPDKNNIINSDERKKKNSKSKGSIAFLKAYYANEQNLKNIKKAEKKEKQDKKEDNKPAEKVEKKAVEENKLILKNAQNKKVRIKLKKAEKIEMIKMLLVLYKKEGLNADVTGIPVEIVKKAKKLYEKKHKGDEKESMKKENLKKEAIKEKDISKHIDTDSDEDVDDDATSYKKNIEFYKKEISEYKSLLPGSNNPKSIHYKYKLLERLKNYENELKKHENELEKLKGEEPKKEKPKKKEPKKEEPKKEEPKEEDEKRKNNKDLEEKKLLQERKKEHLKQGAYKINDPEKEKGIYDMYNKNSIEELKKDIKFFDKDTYLHARASQRSNYSMRLWKLNILKKVLKEKLRIKKEVIKKEEDYKKVNDKYNIIMKDFKKKYKVFDKNDPINNLGYYPDRLELYTDIKNKGVNINIELFYKLVKKWGITTLKNSDKKQLSKYIDEEQTTEAFGGFDSPENKEESNKKEPKKEKQLDHLIIYDKMKNNDNDFINNKINMKEYKNNINDLKKIFTKLQGKKIKNRTVEDKKLMEKLEYHGEGNLSEYLQKYHFYKMHLDDGKDINEDLKNLEKKLKLPNDFRKNNHMRLRLTVEAIKDLLKDKPVATRIAPKKSKKEKPYNDRLNKFIQNGKKHNKKKHCYSLNNQPSCRKNQPHCK